MSIDDAARTRGTSLNGMIKLYRISPARDWRKAAQRPAAARWHTAGRDILYTSSNGALAVIEALAHLAEQPVPHHLTVFEFPDRVHVERIEASALDSDWKSRVAITRGIGDAWLRSEASALLRVPSVHAPDAENVLFNPSHSDARFIRSRPCGLFRFNPRLRRNLRNSG